MSNLKYESFGREVLEATMAVSEGRMNVEQAIQTLKRSAMSKCGLAEVTSMWQSGEKADAVCNILYPQIPYYGTSDDRTPPKTPERSFEYFLRCFLISILNTVELFDENEHLVDGAKKLLAAYPSLIPESEVTFD